MEVNGLRSNGERRKNKARYKKDKNIREKLNNKNRNPFMVLRFITDSILNIVILPS